MYELKWSKEELKATNTLRVIASLPTFFFIPCAYSVKQTLERNEAKCLYKPQSLICWNGKHNLTFMRVSLDDYHKKQWVLMSDTKVKCFENWR